MNVRVSLARAMASLVAAGLLGSAPGLAQNPDPTATTTAIRPCTVGNAESFFNFTGGVQTCIIPATGVYTIEVLGAPGGRARRGGPGGLGAFVSAQYSLTAGQVLIILVGGAGGNGSGFGGGYSGAGGGGASLVALAPLPTEVFPTPLIVAGGGGGAGDSNTGGVGLLIEGMGATGGGNGKNSGGGAGGQNGNGGVNSANAHGGAGGAGLLTSGGFAPTAAGGIGLVYGGAGGNPMPPNLSSPGGSGGFGGGGAVGAGLSGAGGGGGGYSGGAPRAGRGAVAVLES